MRMKLAACLLAATSLPSLAQKAPDLTGRWIVTFDFHGTIFYNDAELEQHGNTITGKFTGDPILEASIEGGRIHLHSRGADGTNDEVTATFADGKITGDLIETEAGGQPKHYGTVMTRTTFIRHETPKRHEFTPTVFYRQFSPFNKPVLTVAPGDTIHTTTVDAGGNDEKGVQRSVGGNPQTGPFYVEGAMPGDTLVVHIVRLKLNRDYAISDDSLDPRALDPGLAIGTRDNNQDVRWHLDLAAGLASPEKPGEHMKSFTIPVHPMLGCVATAVGPASGLPPTGDSGSFGGNMDYNGVAEGATIYLPVSNPGALLYFGDGHALQGDGELNGNALETSMDVEVTVDVLPGKRINGRRIETADALIAMGLQGSLDDAFKEATSQMARWLVEDYKLTPSEVAQFLGVAAEYHVSEAADRNAGMVLIVRKSALSKLTK